AFRAVPLFFEKGVETRVLILPETLDPDGFLRKNGAAAYDLLYPGAAPGLKFIIDYLSREKRLDVPEVKTRVLRAVMDIVEAVPDAIVRSEYFRLTAEHLGVDESLLRSLSQVKPGEAAARPAETFLPAEKRLLQILMENADLRPDIFSELCEEDIAGLKSEPIFAIMLRLFANEQDFSLNEMHKSVEPGLARELSQALLERREAPSLQEALDCLWALRVAGKENALRKIQGEIARAEKSGDREKLESLMSRKLDLTRQVLALR
ncbi:MAG: hypothetical protein GYA74_02695, partial [Acidobacteria bacterium]|nr:hypothetical protein [Acidobacteriota bacterium]